MIELEIVLRLPPEFERGEAMSTKVRASVEDLYNVPENGKAEIVDEELVRFIPTGKRPSRASLKIALILMEYERVSGEGIAVSDNAGFIVDLPNRESFSPNAAWYIGEIGDDETGMDFYEGAPAFAVEVRSKNDYGRVAEQEIADKRRDYFAAGTLVVWDVDLLSDDVVRVYRASDPENPTVYRRGDVAEADPVLSGWRMPVDDLFR